MCEVSSGQWSHENFLKRKLAELGRMETIKDLERIIGVISYTPHCVKDVEMILSPFREGLKTFKSGQMSESWIMAMHEKVRKHWRRQLPICVG